MLNWTVHFYPNNSITYFSYDRSFLFELDISSSILVRIKLREVANGIFQGNAVYERSIWGSCGFKSQLLVTKRGYFLPWRVGLVTNISWFWSQGRYCGRKRDTRECGNLSNSIDATETGKGYNYSRKAWDKNSANTTECGTRNLKYLLFAI